MSQSQLAARSGIPKPRLSRYENGHILPSVPTLTRLSYALGVPPDALLAHDETPVEAFTRTLQQRGFQFRTVEEACALAHEIADRAGGPRSR